LSESSFFGLSAKGWSIAALCSLGYAAGYLALRARAFALGIDPALGLLDEVYVFAGFRFALVTAFALLIVSPLVFGTARFGTAVSRRWPLVELAALPPSMLLVFGQLDVLSAHDVLLRASEGPWAQAVLGRNSNGVLLTLAATMHAALLLIWLRARWRFRRDSTMVLALLAAVQVALLPLINGIFFAERNVRVIELKMSPELDLSEPVAMVFAGSGTSTLLAADARGQRRLVNVKSDSLLGAPVVQVESLGTFVERLDTRGRLPAGASGR